MKIRDDHQIQISFGSIAETTRFAMFLVEITGKLEKEKS